MSATKLQARTRLEQAHLYWHRMAEGYNDPSEFIAALNPALGALREIEYLMRADGKAGVIPGFDTWFAPHLAAAKKDPIVAWIVEARNETVHKGDLEPCSTARIKLSRAWATEADFEVEAPPLLSPEQMARFIAEEVVGPGRSGLIRVERRWVLDPGPSEELLEAIAAGYDFFAKLVSEAHSQCGLEMPLLRSESHNEPGMHPAGRLRCMRTTRELRTARFELEQGRQIVFEERERVFTRKELLGFKEKEGVSDDLLPRWGEDFGLAIERWTKAAEMVLRRTGRHEPIAIMSWEEGPPRQGLVQQLGPAASSDLRHAQMHELAAELAEAECDTFFFIGEAPTPGVFHAGDELAGTLVVAGATKLGRRRTHRIPFTRVGEQTVLAGRQVDLDVPSYFAPVLEVWKAD